MKKIVLLLSYVITLCVVTMPVSLMSADDTTSMVPKISERPLEDRSLIALGSEDKLFRFSGDRAEKAANSYRARYNKVAWRFRVAIGAALSVGSIVLYKKLFDADGTKTPPSHGASHLTTVSGSSSSSTEERKVAEMKRRNDIENHRNELLMQDQKIVNKVLLSAANTTGVGLAGLVVMLLGKPVQHIWANVGVETNVWLSGYDGWYDQQTNMLRDHMGELKESLKQARKMQSEQAHRAPYLGYDSRVNDYYRSKVIDHYHMTLSFFEKVVALMHLIAPEEKHDHLGTALARVVRRFNGFADALEEDISDVAGSDTMTHSETTYRRFEDMYDSCLSFITKFDHYLRD